LVGQFDANNGHLPAKQLQSYSQSLVYFLHYLEKQHVEWFTIRDDRPRLEQIVGKGILDRRLDESSMVALKCLSLN
jgi:hypothetical protein